MVKVYISADIEGVNGVVYPHHIENAGHDGYFSAQKQMHDELNVIIHALIEAGADITVNDSHGYMDNLRLNALNPNVELITGKPKHISMMHGLDSTYSCVFFTGYHSKAGTQIGVLSHTFAGKFNEIVLNGSSVGEIEFNAIYAGLNNVPVAFLSGDNVACQEAIDLFGNIKTVSTKTAISTTSAKCKPNNKLFNELIEKVSETIKDSSSWVLYKKNPPFVLEIDFRDKTAVEIAELLPCIKRISPNRIQFCSENYLEIYKVIQFFAAI